MSNTIDTKTVKYPVKYSQLGTYINDAEDKMVADVRGWGWIQKRPDGEDYQDKLGQFIVDAMNEKHERDSK